MSALRSLLVSAVAPVVMLLVSTGTPFAQVSDCTDSGCDPFELDCAAEGNFTLCLNSRYGDLGEEEPTWKEEFRCNVATAFKERVCSRTAKKPWRQKFLEQRCLNSEDRVLDRCFYVPLTLCVEQIEAAELYALHPDVCTGICGATQGCNNL